MSTQKNGQKGTVFYIFFYTAFFVELMSTLKALKCHFERSYDKQNMTLVVISYEIY